MSELTRDIIASVRSGDIQKAVEGCKQVVQNKFLDRYDDAYAKLESESDGGGGGGG